MRLCILLTILGTILISPAIAAGDHRLRFRLELYRQLLSDRTTLTETVGGLCGWGGGQEAASTLSRHGVAPTTPHPVDLCLTVYTAMAERQSLDTWLSRTSPPDLRAFDLPLGFRDGFTNPAKYDRYRTVPDGHLQRITDGCVQNRGVRSDCVMAGALQGVRIRLFFEQEAKTAN